MNHVTCVFRSHAAFGARSRSRTAQASASEQRLEFVIECGGVASGLLAHHATTKRGARALDHQDEHGDAWELIEADKKPLLRALAESMPHRLSAVIEADGRRGGPTANYTTTFVLFGAGFLATTGANHRNLESHCQSCGGRNDFPLGVPQMHSPKCLFF